jgi:U3 small nucleolar RNA-associated protein 21
MDLGPSAIDLEVLALSPEGGGSLELMFAFVKLLEFSMKSHKNFEAIHAYLGLFLKHHSDAVLESEELQEALKDLKPILDQSWTDLKASMTSTATLVAFAKNSLLTAAG